LVLERLTSAHLEGLHLVFSDPRTWEHLPSGRHTSYATTAALVDRCAESWDEFGLGPWAVLEDGAFVGMGGVNMSLGGLAWNLGFRLSPAVWGRGLASSVARAGVAAARELGTVPVTARVLVANPASQRVVQRVGLSLVWEGGELERRIFSDAPLGPDVLNRLIALG